jgi:phage tail P2-like protein
MATIDEDGHLPAEAGRAEKALAQGVIGAFGFDIPNPHLWNPATCPAALLPWLAWALSVDEWDDAWTEATKRAVIAASVEVHRRKGTVGSIKKALAAAGYGDATVLERFGRTRYNGAILHDGAFDHSEPDHWAEYRVVLARPLTIAQAARVRAILDAVAPARCRLKALDFTEAANLYDGRITHDGSYTHGVA